MNRITPSSPLRSLLFNVGLGFTPALLLMLAVIGLGNTQMAHLNTELQNVVTVNNVKTRLASHMRDTLRDRAVLMHNIVVSNDAWKKDTLFLQFLQSGERYTKDRNQLVAMLTTSDEIWLMDDLDTITASNQPVMFNVVESALDGNNAAALKLLQDHAIPLQDRLVEALDKMTSLQREANEAALEKTYAAYQSTRNLMLVLGIIATLLATLAVALVSRRMLKQTRQTEAEKQKYQTLFETNSDAVVILDDTGFIDCNPATLSLFGMDSVATFLGTPIPQLGTPVQASGATSFDHAKQAIALARKQGHAAIDWLGRRQDGSIFSAEIALHAMQLEGRPVIQAIMRDVSERQATEAAREAARQAALQAARTKTEFVATVSHEIRTPMHGILGMSDLLLKTPLNNQQRDYALMLKNSASGLLNIINDILDFSKIEAGKLVIENVPFSPSALLQNLFDLFHARAQEKNITLTLRLPDNSPPALLGDPTRLRQVLLNLLDNAIKFTPRGEVELSATYQTDGNCSVCRFAVSDTGIGVPDDSIARVFEAFSQADSSTTRLFGGTGLGLTISRQLTELMGGTLQVKSKQGEGSRFTLELSLLQGNLPMPDPSAKTEAVQLRGRILIVEDHPVNQKLLAYQLSAMGLQHVLANNGSEALERYQSDTFDLVFMDWQMPKMDGLEATRRIRQMEGGTRHVPIIALTAHAAPEFRKTCLAAGADDYLSKPYSESALAATLSRWLAHAADTPRPLAESPATEQPLDRHALLARYQNDHTLVDELISMFLSTTEASIDAIRKQLAEGNSDACRKEAHALRGAAASVLATTLQTTATELENCLRTSNCTEGKRLLAELENELIRLHAKLAQTGKNH
jgi:PAS domain S-box-containing protein